jgi:hypothetical protein
MKNPSSRRKKPEIYLTKLNPSRMIYLLWRSFWKNSIHLARGPVPNILQLENLVNTLRKLRRLQSLNLHHAHGLVLVLKRLNHHHHHHPSFHLQPSNV